MDWETGGDTYEQDQAFRDKYSQFVEVISDAGIADGMELETLSSFGVTVRDVLQRAGAVDSHMDLIGTVGPATVLAGYVALASTYLERMDQFEAAQDLLNTATKEADSLASAIAEPAGGVESVAGELGEVIASFACLRYDSHSGTELSSITVAGEAGRRGDSACAH